MYCYSVMDNGILKWSLQKHFKKDESLAKYVRDFSQKNVCTLGDINVHDLTEDVYENCKKLTDISEDVCKYEWFVSVDNNAVLALAVICIIERHNLWSLLMNKEDFDNWIKTNVR